MISSFVRVGYVLLFTSSLFAADVASGVKVAAPAVGKASVGVVKHLAGDAGNFVKFFAVGAFDGAKHVGKEFKGIVKR